ncbi:MAG: DUF1501 domain-containing protein, partial [Planctomycetaceae bacterium]
MNPPNPRRGSRVSHFEIPRTRRDFLCKAGAGFGAVALAGLLDREARLFGDSRASESPLSAKRPQFLARAKSVIFLFMEGGPSHLDTFDPKPLLNELAGRPIPDSFDVPITPPGEGGSPLLGSKRKWRQYGESGTWVSDWLPYASQIVDDIAVIRSCWTDGINHAGGCTEMNTGSPLAGRPSLGAWVSYGLGTENENLPAFVVVKDQDKPIAGGPLNWGNGFMPAVYQGTLLSSGDEPIRNLNNPKGITDDRQRGKLDLLETLNRRHAEARPLQTELEARIASYELAFRMQAAAPEAVDLAEETEATQRLYGMDRKQTAVFARNCILARRLVERGVRFVQLYHGAGSKWDAHSAIEKNHTENCLATDQPVAALIKDLKQRGLLDETLVIWGGEFGRTPMSEKGDGRDHNAT